MRIIAGIHRSRKLQGPPSGETTRPLPDRVKESLFGHMRGHVEGARVLDVFAGTGTFGLEAISRGAASATFVERDKRMAKVLGENIAALKEQERCAVVAFDALSPALLARVRGPFDLVLFDPPYPLVRDESTWQRVKTQFERVVAMLSDEGYAMLRTPWPFVRNEKPPMPDDAELAQSIEIDLSDPDADDALDAAERAFAEITGSTKPVDVDLEMDGAVGPETHAYGTTAVHLYMRARRDVGEG